MASGSLLAANTGLFYLVSHRKDTIPSSQRTDRAVILVRVHMMLTLKQNKREDTGLTTEKDIPPQDDKPGTSCVSPLSPGKELSKAHALGD